MKREQFFARTKDDISKAAVDFFSIGHILMGQISYFIAWFFVKPDGALFTFVGEPTNSGIYALSFAIFIGLIWEPIENIILWKMGLKFEGKRDSWLNLIFDIIFVTGGAVMAYFIHDWDINLILVIIEFILFFNEKQMYQISLFFYHLIIILFHFHINSFSN